MGGAGSHGLMGDESEPKVFELVERPWGALLVVVPNPEDPKIKAHHDWCRLHVRNWRLAP
jgi:hypothetical protein